MEGEGRRNSIKPSIRVVVGDDLRTPRERDHLKRTVIVLMY